MKRRAFIRNAALAAAAIAAPAVRAAKARIVIVGGGFGGSACALFLKHAAPSLDVTLIDRDARYVTCPMSNEVVVGARSIESLTVTRDGLRRAGVRFVRARAKALDVDARSIRLEDGARLAYDRCVVAPGVRFLWGTPEGYDEAACETMPHAWEAGAQTTRLAQWVQGIDDGGVFAISVPSGLMRCPPGPYERASLVAEYFARHKPRSKVLIFDANNRFPRQEAFTSAWDTLYRGRIEWIPVTEGGAVERVDPRTNTLHTSSGAHHVALANVIPPQAPGGFALDSELASGHGWCPVDPSTFASTLVPHVHVIGDACIADAMPKAASAALSQARRCAAAIVASLAGRELPVPALDSVCYSAVALDRALAIRLRFRLVNGRIEPEPTAGDASTMPSAAEREGAGEWYRSIRAEAFGV
ncbi:MAG TPA: FAD/NAD(P)-binding oxidoreductase [Rhodanobacteraceae bacterium]|nr:FAD/NAD(P)-binding oxidoreductase [Rhodanobacteraceae bacterium]